MVRQKGVSIIEFILVALTICLLLAIILKNYSAAVLTERRSLAQQALITTVGLQERWFIRMFEYTKNIDNVGGADAAGANYVLKLTQDPCGDASCFTVTAVAVGEQADDVECERMSLTNLGVKRALNRSNQDTTAECWQST